MNKIRLFTIPNIITGLNLLSGCFSCLYAFEGQFQIALFFIVLSAVFDFFDGMVARLLHSSSVIGKELDSLADDISFGLAPSIIVFSWMKSLNYLGFWESCSEYMPYIAFLIAIMSAFRLAKFNIDDRQTSSFIGLPVPANALFWAGLVVGAEEYQLAVNPLLVAVAVVLFSWLLVSEIPMFSLKFKNLSLKDNGLQFLFLLICIPLLLFLKFAGIPAIIGLYIILSVLSGFKKK